MRQLPSGVRFLLIAALALSGCEGCGDDSHKGTISHGPTPSSTASGAATAPKVRLIYGPGSPLATMRVATVFKARLAALGIDKRSIKVGGEQIHVDVPQSKAEAVKKALELGRLDLFVFDDKADPFASKTAEHAKHYSVESEKVGVETMRFLQAPPDRRKKLQTYLDQHSTGAVGMLGPVYAGESAPVGYRSYYVQAGRSVRGEFVKAAKVEHKDGATDLLLSFEASGKAFVLWNSKQRSRFVLRVDELVLGAAQPSEPVKDGLLRIRLEPRGDAKATLAAAESIAKRLDGVALSHLTKLDKQRPL